MNVRRESRQENYGVVVVGSGIGGLTAAALLARAGKKVLVVERYDRPGGYAHAFRRKMYIFDAAVHLIGGCEPTGSPTGGLIDLLLRLLNVRDRYDFVRVDPFYSAVFPGFKLHAPLGMEAYLEAHIKHFPSEEKGFRRVYQLCSQINEEIRQLPGTLSLWDFIRMPRRFPKVFRYHKAVLAQVMDAHLTDSRLKSVFASLWPYLGLPPSRLSFLYWSVMLMSFVEEGAFYCRGSFQKLADAFVTALQNNGGEILLGTRVRRILVKNRQATGVVLENGQRIQAPLVISNADAMATFEELLGIEHLPARFLKGLRRLKPSLSAFVAYMATDLDLRQMDAGHEMFFYRSWNHERTYQDILAGRPSGIVMSVPTLIDSSLAPAGEHLVTVTSLVPYEIGSSWRQQKSRYAEVLLDEVEAIFPGFRSHITFLEGASPRTMERYTLNLTGAIYGWEVSPEQVGQNRLAHESPIRGLYLAGHWTQPGGGIYGVVASGVQTAQIIMGYPNTADFLDALSAAIPT